VKYKIYNYLPFILGRFQYNLKIVSEYLIRLNSNFSCLFPIVAQNNENRIVAALNQYNSKTAHEFFNQTINWWGHYLLKLP